MEYWKISFVFLDRQKSNILPMQLSIHSLERNEDDKKQLRLLKLQVKIGTRERERQLKGEILSASCQLLKQNKMAKRRKRKKKTPPYFFLFFFLKNLTTTYTQSWEKFRLALSRVACVNVSVCLINVLFSTNQNVATGYIKKKRKE